MSGRVLALLLVFLLLTAAVHAHPIITRMSDRQNISMSQLADAAGNFDVVLIGEVHDNKGHHDMELDLIRLLSNGEAPLAIGMEMIQADYQQQLNDWTEGRMSEQAMKAVYTINWSQDWQLYRDIFLFARNNHIPLVALNVPLAIVRKVSQHGFAALTPAERRDLPEGTGCDLSNPQIALLRKSFQDVGSHKGEGKMFVNFCEAQTVRNSGMALNMARYLRGHPGHKIVGLTGIWHAEKYAIPEQLSRYDSKLSYTVILPETPELNSDNSGANQVDYLVDR